MKKLSISIIFIISVITAQAQLTVNSTGTVTMPSIARIGSNPPTNCTLGVSSMTVASSFKVVPSGNSTMSGVTNRGVLSNVTHSGSETSIGVEAVVNGTGTAGKRFGIFAEALNGPTGHNHGVFGHITNHYGAAIHGSTHSGCAGCYVPGIYAGYFEGNVLVAGNISSSASINGILLGQAAGVSSSNKCLVSDADIYNSRVMERLTDLDVCSFSSDKLIPGDDRLPEEVEMPELSFMEKQVQAKLHYGLDAEQLEEVFPDLVYENEDGSKSINYVEMVPILVQAINELKSEISELRGVEVKPQTRATERNEEASAENVILLSLGENKPNPFSNTTTIPVSIPETVEKAFIYVYDLTGKKVQQLDVTARGKQNVTLDSSALADGMYLYSLIADGKVVQTRRMIVEKYN